MGLKMRRIPPHVRLSYIYIERESDADVTCSHEMSLSILGPRSARRCPLYELDLIFTGKSSDEER